MSEESFKQYWIGRKQIIQYWDAKSEELKHMATWFQAWAKSLDRISDISAQLTEADRANEQLKARIEGRTNTVNELEKVIDKLQIRLAQAEAACAAYREVLQTLRNETRGTLHAHELAIRYDHGNSNWRCLEIALEQADKALTTTPGADLLERMRKLEAVAEAARRLDRAVAEFGLEPEFVREVYQHFHDALSALNEGVGG